MNNFKVVLSAQISIQNKDIIVTDPCYFLCEDIWRELIDLWWFPETDPIKTIKGSDFVDQGVMIFSNGAKVLYSATANGDGEFPVYVSKSNGQSVHNNKTGVDAGTIAIVTIEDLRKIEKDFGPKDGTPFDENDVWYPRINNFTGSIAADGNGNFIGDVYVDTQEKEESEDDEYYDEWNKDDEE
jgi:hypothetical protein